MFCFIKLHQGFALFHLLLLLLLLIRSYSHGIIKSYIARERNSQKLFQHLSVHKFYAIAQLLYPSSFLSSSSQQFFSSNNIFAQLLSYFEIKAPSFRQCFLFWSTFFLFSLCLQTIFNIRKVKIAKKGEIFAQSEFAFDLLSPPAPRTIRSTECEEDAC